MSIEHSTVFVGSMFEYSFILVMLIGRCNLLWRGQFVVYEVLISGNCNPKNCDNLGKP